MNGEMMTTSQRGHLTVFGPACSVYHIVNLSDDDATVLKLAISAVG